ncbi:hypothetical protein AC249_AIPGENE898, partial [Exaiptasia diaphana]
MREELRGPKVENVAVAVVQHVNELNEKIYNVYLLNLREDIMEGIMITSKGYGHNANSGEKVETSTLRHCLEVLLPNEAAKIEPIMEDVFGLANEYWDVILSDYEIPAIISLPDETANIGASTKPEIKHVETDIKWEINVGQNFQLLIEDYGDITDLIEVEKKELENQKFFKVNYLIDEGDMILYERTLLVSGSDQA